jgi:hypothetical protein
MGTKAARAPARTKEQSEEARFEQWLRDFDARQADLSARLDAVLHSLGVDPARATELQTV